MTKRGRVAKQLGLIGAFLAKNAPPRRVMLTHADFRMLVGGSEVERDGLVIALADIGFHEMSKAINDAWELQMRTEI